MEDGIYDDDSVFFSVVNGVWITTHRCRADIAVHLGVEFRILGDSIEHGFNGSFE